MKKDAVVTTRIPLKMKEAIQSLADKDERDLAWMVRKLLAEALEQRGLNKSEKKK